MKCENEKCGKEHDGSFGSGRFCCRSCANSRGARSYEIREKISKTLTGGKPYIEKGKEIKLCLNCNNTIKEERKYCSHKCQREYQYKQNIERWKNGEVDGLKCNGNAVTNYVRKYLWEKYDNKCSRCGWNTPNPVTGKPILEIEHIDGNSTNNDESNLDLICPNCHSLTPTYKALNIGNGNKKRLKYFGLI